MPKAKNRKSHRFRPGARGGCEALLWEFREGNLQDDAEPNLQTTLRQLPPRVVLIVANTLDEALAYLRLDRPDFEVHTVNCLGLVIMVSGSPLN